MLWVGLLIVLLLVAGGRVLFDHSHWAEFGQYWFMSAFGQFGMVVALGIAGFMLGVSYTVSLTAAHWPPYILARGWLALHRRLPWRFMDFLADAHRRGVLRQAGAVYQFRHIELQHRLATRPSEPPEMS
jgi:hypothetical protein